MNKYIIILALFFAGVHSLYAQNGVSGVVVDNTGEVLIGATVTIKGKYDGTVTDLDGKFSLENVASDAVLVVSYLGFDTKEMEVGGKTFFNVVLEGSSIQIEEVVAIGYGNVQRRDLTGAVASVKSADIVKSATANYDQALAGRIAGVQVSSADGTPGEALNIVIRGGNSITGDNSPLYVVDGVPLESFDPSSISSSDIKSLDVLKDASSTAIYGSRGANGVILITTKSGRTDGKTDVNVRASYGMSYVQNRLEVMSPYDYARYQLEAAYSSDQYTVGTNVKDYINRFGMPELYLGVEGTSWQDEIMQVAPMLQTNASISTGNDKSTLYYSAELIDQEGGLVNTGFMKVTNNLKFTHKFNEGSKFTGQLMYNYSDKEGVNVSGNNYTSVIRDAVQFRPIEPIFDNSDGMYDESDTNSTYLYNPVEALNNTQRSTKTNNIRATAGFEQKLYDKLKLNLSGTYIANIANSSVFYEADTQQGERGNNRISANLSDANTQTMQGSAILNYSYSKSGHRFSAMLGSELESRVYATRSYGVSHLATDQFGLDKLQISTSPLAVSSLRNISTMASVFSRINYSYKSKYLMTVNFRADGSSKFSKENRWGYFPSTSLAWRASEEDFLSDVSWLTNLKLRGGWGITGNNRIGTYDYLTYLDINTDSAYVWGDRETSHQGVYLANLGVDDLTWETTSQTSIGLDIGAFRNRLTATIDWYHKRTYDLLLDAEMALSFGHRAVQQNVGEVVNKGFELSISSVNFDNPKFKWYTTFNISTNDNRIVKLNSGQDYILTNPSFSGSVDEYSYISKVGEPVGQIYGLVYDGVYSWDDFNYNNETGTHQLKAGVADNGSSSVAPGSVKFVDQNNDGTINELDRVVLGDTSPTHFGGLTNDFVIHKNFDVSVFFQWSVGGKILNANNAVVGVAENRKNNTLGDVADFWNPYNPNTDNNAIRYFTEFGAPRSGNMINDTMVEDGSYLKLKSLSFGYSLPKHIIHRLKIKKLRVYVSAQNLYTWSNYSGYDPDVSVGRYGALTPRLDYSAYPQSTTLLAGAELTF